MTIHTKTLSLFINRYFYHSPKLMFNLFNCLDSIEEFIDQLPRLNSQFNLNVQDLMTKLKSFSYDEEQHHLKKHGIEIVFYDDELYPAILKEYADPPLLLYCKGDTSLLNQQQLAIVGPRHPSSYGEDVARYFTHELSKHFVITSGLAAGIDAIAHRECLKHNAKTIAVIGTGLNIAYPNKHYDLQTQLFKDGLVISEFPFNTPPLKYHFPQRNRLISGLSQGVLLCEASLKSGSLITANFALEQNKDVYAVPGSIFSPHSEGVHQLIQDGAKCVHHPNDILEDFNLKQVIDQPSLFQPTKEKESKDYSTLNSDETTIINLLSKQPTSIDALMSTSSFSIHHILPILTGLEIKGFIKQSPGKQFSLL